MDIKKTKSYENIKYAFACESEAANKYNIYAYVARNEGHEDIASLFEKMAKNEQEHAKIWYKLLNGGFNSTLENLKNASDGENLEWKNLYPQFAQQAREEGLENLAVTFEGIASIERDHERRFLENYFNLANGNILEKAHEEDDDKIIKYYCVFCGHGKSEIIDTCPVCQSKDSFAK